MVLIDCNLLFSSNVVLFAHPTKRPGYQAFKDQTTVTMGLLDLPNELLLSIAQYLEYQWNISALSQVNRRLYLLLDDYVYQFCQEHFSGSLGKGLQWAVEHGSESLTRKMLDADAGG